MSVSNLRRLDLNYSTLDCCRVALEATMLLFDSLFVAVGCFLLTASERKELNLPGGKAGGPAAGS